MLQSFLNKKFRNRQVAVEIASQKRSKGNQEKRKRKSKPAQNKRFKKAGTKKKKSKANKY